MGEAIKIEVNVRAGKLPVWAREGGQTTLVFLHFWGGSHRTFDQVIARLEDGCRTVSYDHRGWGAARALSGPYGIEELADDALMIVAELGLERYVLVGHSMGERQRSSPLHDSQKDSRPSHLSPPRLRVPRWTPTLQPPSRTPLTVGTPSPPPSMTCLPSTPCLPDCVKR
jgi:hypothetical protein